MRITQKYLEERIGYLRELTGRNYQLDSAYGGYRLVIVRKDTSEVDISERLPARELNTFISGMMHICHSMVVREEDPKIR